VTPRAKHTKTASLQLSEMADGGKQP